MRWSLLLLLLSGCSLAQLNKPPTSGFARVYIPKLEDGQFAVNVFAIDSKHHFVTQPVKPEQRVGLSSLSLRPGTYSLEIECRRPGAWFMLHGGFDFEISVESLGQYLLDCAPTIDPKLGYRENNFSFTTLPNYSSKPTP